MAQEPSVTTTDGLASIDASATISDARQRMRETGAEALVVSHNGRVIGAVSADQLDPSLPEDDFPVSSLPHPVEGRVHWLR